jgi:hypothetical protein
MCANITQNKIKIAEKLEFVSLSHAHAQNSCRHHICQQQQQRQQQRVEIKISWL